MNPIATLSINEKFTAKIFHDETPENPRNFCNQCKMYFWHRAYDLGDSHDYPKTVTFTGKKDVVRFFKKSNAHVFPVYMMDHSGFSFSMDPKMFQAMDPHHFDWGFLGVIVIEKKTRKARKIAQAELDIYSAYVEGDVYGYEIFDQSGDLVDSCWGYYGIDEVRDAAISAL